MRYKGTKEVEVSNYEVIDVVFLYDYGSIEILKLMWGEVDVLPLLEDWGKDIVFDLKVKLEAELNEED
jgi:hypothetical protein